MAKSDLLLAQKQNDVHIQSLTAEISASAVLFEDHFKHGPARDGHHAVDSYMEACAYLLGQYRHIFKEVQAAFTSFPENYGWILGRKKLMNYVGINDYID